MKDEMDILKEVGTITAAHGSIALSEILGTKINLEIPSVDIIPSGTILKRINPDEIVISVSSCLLSGLKGNVLFVLNEPSAFKLIDLCAKFVGSGRKGSGLLTEMGISTIKEIGNVVIASYSGALSILLKTLIIPSIPTLASGPIKEVVTMASCPYKNGDYLVMSEATFIEEKEKITGSFYMILNTEAMRHIQETCKKMIS